MSKIEKVSIALPTEMLETVKDAVSSGQYASASEVVREALREWELRQGLRRVEIERLRRAWEEGLASGEPQPFDPEDTKRRARDRFAAMKDNRA